MKLTECARDRQSSCCRRCAALLKRVLNTVIKVGERPVNPRTPKKSRKPIIWVIVILLILNVCALAAIGYTYYRNNQAGGAGSADGAGGTESSISSDIGKAVLTDKDLGEMVQDTMAASHVYSHRGNGAGVEEHSLAAYDKAIEDGSMYIEQDVVVSADGTLYVSHDQSAKRLTGSGADYAGMTDDQIDALTTRAGNHVLKLSEVFDRYGSKITYVVELKNRDSRAAESFASLVRQYGNEDNIIVQCFSLDILRQLEEEFPGMTKLYLCKTSGDVYTGLDADYVDIISVDKRIMSEDLCREVHNAGKLFSVWTIDTEYEIIRAIEIGADTYFTNNTPLALELERQYRNPEKPDTDTRTDTGAAG